MGAGSLECPPPPICVLQAEVRVCLLSKITPWSLPAAALGFHQGLKPRVSAQANLQPERSQGRVREVWGTFGWQCEDTGSLQRGKHPPSSLPEALTPQHTRLPQPPAPGLVLGVGAFQFLAPHKPPLRPGLCRPSLFCLPSLCPLSLPVSVTLLFFSAVLSACLPLSLSPSSSFLAGRGGAGGGSSTLRPPWGLILRGSERGRGRRARKGEKEGSRRALRVSVRVRVGVGVPGPTSPGAPAEGPGGLGRAGGLLGGRGSERRRRRGEPRRRRREERAEQPLLRETLQTKKAPDSPQPLAPQTGLPAPGPRPSGHCNFPPGLQPPPGRPRLCVRVFVRPV